MHLKSLHDERIKFLYSPSVQIVFLQMEKLFSSILPKSVYQVSLRIKIWSTGTRKAQKDITWQNSKTNFDSSP